MQAALRDLTPTRTTNPRPFLICQRVLHRCHEIIFGDPPEPSRSPYRSLPHSPPNSTAALLASSTMKALRSGFADDGVRPAPVRVNEHVLPAMIGMGVILAGPGMRGLVDLAGEWAVLQGRKARDDAGEGRARVEVKQGGGAEVSLATTEKIPERKVSEDTEESDEETGNVSTPEPPGASRFERRASQPPSSAPPTALNHPHPHPSSTVPNLHSPPLLSTPTLSHHRSASPSPSRRVKGDDPFSQQPSTPPPAGPSRTHTPPKTPPQPFYSVPELSSRSAPLRRLNPTDRPPPADNLLATYSPDAQRQLLRSHYCRTQVRFLLLLEDISNRLLVVPKPARVSALRAELTSLNHNLPAEVSDIDSRLIGIDKNRCACPSGVQRITATKKAARPHQPRRDDPDPTECTPRGRRLILALSGSLPATLLSSTLPNARLSSSMSRF